MEFFQEVHSAKIDVLSLQKLLTINNLTILCASISTLSAQKEDEADIYCIWGSFYVKREEIRYGVRFSLLNCPHALAWTITYDEQNQNIIIHCTIDKTETDSDFVDSIHEFVLDWSNGIAKALNQTHSNSFKSDGAHIAPPG